VSAVIKHTIIVLTLLSLLAGCSSSKNEKSNGTGVPLSPKTTISDDAQSNYKIGNPYEIAGIRYVPEESFNHVETGRASWYGPGFHSRQTANGEPFDQRAMTAAHRTLQMPSIIRVTNLKNGRQAVLRVNDRGPYHADRILDVSEAAAEKLGFMRRGTTRVKIQVLGEPSKKVAELASRGATISELEAVRAETSSITGLASKQEQRNQPTEAVKAGSSGNFIQAGAFRSLENANKYGVTLEKYGPYQVERVSLNGKPIYLVRIGPYENVSQAKQVLSKILTAGIKDAHVVTVR
jgi:rare lipoprotein A